MTNSRLRERYYFNTHLVSPVVDPLYGHGIRMAIEILLLDPKDTIYWPKFPPPCDTGQSS